MSFQSVRNIWSGHSSDETAYLIGQKKVRNFRQCPKFWKIGRNVVECVQAYHNSYGQEEAEKIRKIGILMSLKNYEPQSGNNR